jgi:alpha-tubulin suppressor-like RCC1 family protein
MPKRDSEDGDNTIDMSKDVDPQHYHAPIEACLDMAIIQIACGEEHTLILTKDNKIFGMGSNSSGQLGNPNNKSQQENFRNRHFEPIPINLGKLVVTKLACGEQHSLALTKRGQVFAWGQARYGQLGINFMDKENVGLRTQKSIKNALSKNKGSFENLNFKGIDISFVEKPTLI